MPTRWIGRAVPEPVLNDLIVVGIAHLKQEEAATLVAPWAKGWPDCVTTGAWLGGGF